MTARAGAKLLLSLSSLLTLGGLAPVAFADDVSDLQGLLDEKVVSTVSKKAEVQSAAPATSTVITAEDLHDYGIHSLDEAINFLAIGMVVEDPGQQHDMEVSARGVQFTKDYGDHVLLLVNGHTMNEQWDGAAYFDRTTAVPMDMIDHIEVILGPGSVLYGADAVLGVINIVTKRAKDWSGGHVAVEADLATSLRATAGVGEEFKIGHTKGEVTFVAEYFAQKGPTFSYGPQQLGAPTRETLTGPPVSVWGGAEKESNWSQIPSGFLRAELGPFELNARAAMSRRSIDSSGAAFDDPSNRENEHWLQGDIRHHVLLSPRAELTSRLYGDSYDYREHLDSPDPGECLVGQDNGCTYDLLGVSRWAGLEEQLSYDWLGDGTLTSLLGADGRIRYFGSQTDYADLQTGHDPGSLNVYDRTEHTVAVYLEQQWSPVKEVHLNAGGRFDYDEAFGSAFSPRGAVAVEPWKNATLKMIYAEAFRAANGYERFYADPTFEVASPDLKPEKVRSLEGRFEQRFGSVRLFLGAFHSWLRDLVASTDLTPAEIARDIANGQLQPGTSSAEQYRNVANLESYGFDFGFEGSALKHRLRFGLSITVAHALEDASEGAPDQLLPVAAQMFGNGRVAYDLGHGFPTLALVGRVVGKRPADDYQDGYTPVPYGPTVGQFRATVSGKVPHLNALGYRASATLTTADRTPYGVGPGSTDGSLELTKYDRFRTTVGLSYDFGP